MCKICWENVVSKCFDKNHMMCFCEKYPSVDWSNNNEYFKMFCDRQLKLSTLLKIFKKRMFKYLLASENSQEKHMFYNKIFFVIEITLACLMY